MLLNDRTRIVLFWFTIGLMLVVAVLAGLAILRACGGLPVQREPAPSIVPNQASLCPGEQQQFSVQEDVSIRWQATGGSIDADGLFTAGENPGAYSVTAEVEGSTQAAGAIVTVIDCAPTPTATPAPTSTPTPLPTPTATPSVTPSLDLDPQGDVVTYADGEPIESPPPGADLRGANIDPDLSVMLQPTEGVPEGLVDWWEEGEVLLWVSLYEPVPDPPARTMNWLVVIDVDGSAETGRPTGSRLINPDIGDEVALGLTYNNTTETYEPYSMVWDGSQWATGPQIRYTFAEDRTVVAMAVSLEALEQALARVGAAALVPGEARARAAAETYLGDGTRVIDFYPDLPGE